MRKKHGVNRSKKLKVRIKNMKAAETLEDLRNAPGNWHELTGDRSGLVSASLDGPYRVIIKPEEWVEKPDGGLDWSAVRSVEIVDVVDYH